METVTEKYPFNMRILHWLMAVLVIGMLISGLIMGGLPKDVFRDQVYFFHKSCGVAVLILAVLRLFIRLFSRIPPLPDMIPALDRMFAHLGHLGLYFFMIAIPVSGIAMSNSYGYGVPFFGIDLPKLFPFNPASGQIAREAHEYMAYALILLISLHVLGALKHLVKERINLFKRIT